MRTTFAAFAAFVFGAALATSAAFAVDRVATAGQSSCATFSGVSNVTPGFWNAKTAPTYRCTSWPRKCAEGTKPLENSAAISGDLVNQPAQTKYGVQNGEFFYTCGVPATLKPTT